MSTFLGSCLAQRVTPILKDLLHFFGPMYLVTLRQFSFAVACYWVFRVAKPRYVIENCPSKFYVFSSDKRPPLKLSGVLQTIVVYQVCPAKTNGSPSRAFCHFRPSERFLPTTLHRRSTKSHHTRPDRSLYKQSSAIQKDTRCLHQHNTSTQTFATCQHS